MSNSVNDVQRRKVMKVALASVVAVPLGSLVFQGLVRAGDLPPVSEDDPAAKGLKYVHDAAKATDPKHKAGQFCKNCNLIRSNSGEWRECAIFPGKSVNENGWCTAWVRKS